MPSMEWGKVQITPEIEDEQEGKDVNLGVEGSNSNGHGKEKDKEEHIMKILEGLQREAKARRDDSRKLMKVMDRQGAVNLKFLKSLERIEKKLEKGRDSSMVESHRTHGEEVGRGVVADILVAPKDILTVRHTVVQAHPLQNIENLERRN
jgi:hypothetical protein